mgnify:CR=1 FL=1
MNIIARCAFFFFQAEDGIRVLVRSRGLGDVYKRQGCEPLTKPPAISNVGDSVDSAVATEECGCDRYGVCLLYTSDAADERSSVDLGGRRIIKKKKKGIMDRRSTTTKTRKNNMIKGM